MSPSEQVPFSEWMAGVTDEKIDELARRTRDAGVWLVPTMFLWESLFASFAPESAATRPEMKYAPKQWVAGWITQKRNASQANTQAGITPELAQQLLAHRRKLLKALADAHAPMLMGTDSPQMFNVPGFALHRELRLMGEAGLTPCSSMRIRSSRSTTLTSARASWCPDARCRRPRTIRVWPRWPRGTLRS